MCAQPFQVCAASSRPRAPPGQVFSPLQWLPLVLLLVLLALLLRLLLVLLALLLLPLRPWPMLRPSQRLEAPTRRPTASPL